MIKVTPEAAKQITESANKTDSVDLPLRIAAKKLEDGSFDYGMGFEPEGREDDLKFTCEGLQVIVSPASLELLHGTVLDYVEMEAGQFHFIFINPNDPEHNTQKQN